MTKTQFARWRRLSLGLARHGYPTITRARRKKLIAAVDDAIEWVVCNDGDLERIDDWDRGPVYVCDRMTQWAYDNGHSHHHFRTDREKGNRFENQVGCCLRAGFDVAVKPSAGVLGFTVADLRKIFRDRIPQWVSNWFDPPLAADAPADGALWL